MSELSDLELLAELGVSVEKEKPKTYTALEAGSLRVLKIFSNFMKSMAERRAMAKTRIYLKGFMPCVLISFA